LLTDTAARWLLVLHTALGVAAVGAATHLVLWMRGYLRGRYARHAAVRRFAVIALALHAGGFVVGNVVYPTYRIEVRAAYLDDAGAVVEHEHRRAAALERVARREGQAVPQLDAPADQVARARRAARWFDVKEHWIALGLIGSLGLVALLLAWTPARSEHSAVIAPFAFGLAIVVAATLWLAAIVGILTSAWRAIG
jgi:hypothetical protein